MTSDRKDFHLETAYRLYKVKLRAGVNHLVILFRPLNLFMQEKEKPRESNQQVPMHLPSPILKARKVLESMMLPDILHLLKFPGLGNAKKMSITVTLRLRQSIGQRLGKVW